jgi:hypothetical protein
MDRKTMTRGTALDVCPGLEHADVPAIKHGIGSGRWLATGGGGFSSGMGGCTANSLGKHASLEPGDNATGFGG